jgi:hypothetical protein
VAFRFVGHHLKLQDGLALAAAARFCIPRRQRGVCGCGVGGRRRSDCQDSEQEHSHELLLRLQHHQGTRKLGAHDRGGRVPRGRRLISA